MNNIVPITPSAGDDFFQPGGYREPLAARWAHVLAGLDVTCDPEDIPEHCNLLPDFGDREGTLFYCEACTGATWRPSIVRSACTLVGMAQCRRVVLLGDVHAEEPAIGLVSLPEPGQWWMHVPFAYQAGLRLRIRRTRPGHHVAVLVGPSGEATAVGPERSRHRHRGYPRSEADLAKLFARARLMTVADPHGPA